MKRSYVGAFRAMTAAFVHAEAQILGRGRTWNATNVDQERLVGDVFPITYAEVDKIPETETIVDWSEVPINGFLERRGVDIRLDVLGPDTFGFAAFMKISVEWELPGDWCTVKVGKTHYHAAHLSTSDGTVSFSSSPRHDQPVAALRTKTGDVVYITKFDEDLNPFDLIERAQEIVDTRVTRVGGFGGVVFPATDMDVRPDLEWMLNMWTTLDDGRTGTLVQALQQCKLKMDHVGATVEDAFASACCLESCMDIDPDLTIDGSFLFILTRPGLRRPVFVAVVREDAWKDADALEAK